MKLRFFIIVFVVLTTPLLGAASDANTTESEATGAQKPEVRPRLHLPAEMVPYRYASYRYLDPWDYWTDPYYAGHRWRHGYRSDLYFDTLYGYMPEPGHSKLSVSVGSDDYFGTSLSHTGYLDEKHNIAYNVATLWETGETYWTHRDYDSFTVAPTFFWNNENTSIYVGFAYTETRFDDDHMSPFRVENAKGDSNQFQAVRVHQPSDYVEKRGSVGIEHQVNDVLSIGFHFEASDIDRKRLSGSSN